MSWHRAVSSRAADLGHGDGPASSALPIPNTTGWRTHTPSAASDLARQEVIMNHADRIARSLVGLTRHAGAPLTHRGRARCGGRPRPPALRRNGHSPLPAPARTTVTAEPRGGARTHPPRERLRTRILPARLPHTIQLCIHCQDRPAGFWVSSTGDQTVRRPWCLSCCEGLDHDSCDVVPFDP